MKKRKIALVYDAIYPFSKGGGERRFYELGKCLSNKATEVHLYGMKYWDGPNTIERDGLVLHGIMRKRHLYTKSGRRSISQALLFGLACFRLAGQDFDVMDCCGFPFFSLFSCRLITWVRGKPMYATWHEVWGKVYWLEYLGALGFFGFHVERLASRLPDSIITNSDRTAELLQSELQTNRPISVIPNGIDLKAIADVEPAEDGTDVLYAGRLMDFKNVELIIGALAHLNESGVELACTIIGEGPHKADLQIMAREHGIADNFRWLGFLENSREVYAHMKASKVLVLPSKREGFGIVVVEANACGTPVLAADYVRNGAKYLVRDGVNGYIFQPHRDDLSAALIRVLGDRDHMERSTRDCAKEYGWDHLSRKLTKVYGI